MINPCINILKTTLSESDNTILVQLGDVINNQVQFNDAQYIQQPGFASLPSLAVPGVSSSEAMVYHTIERDYIFASRDYQSQDKYGHLKPGETCLYGSGADGKAQGRIKIDQDGDVIISTTTDNTDGGQSISFEIKHDGFGFYAPWGSLVFDKTGFHVTHTSGASFHMGGMAAPGPLSALGSYVRISAATTTIDSSAVLLGSSSAYLPSCTAPLAGLPAPPFSGTGSSCVFVGI